ncbi:MULTISPECIES: MFS transporter [unclassified Aurantimonas]|uniref:MFS transporter n=1 Tax=unclassified Aurantimonas TaxID=2638230 RepID=UPI002E18BE68|nr:MULTISPECIES: MFS transporter [unclassified Aurantimonas]MEC5290366.1 MFS transporter [Aurantimonas sp. C2-3-R2]MEC5411378.1 MFS transporter [Aurantimonas sp. C2-4-R8]
MNHGRRIAVGWVNRLFFTMPSVRIAAAIAFFVNGFVLGSWAPQVPVLADRLAISQSTLGLFVLVLGLGAMTAMPLIGMTIAKGGSRRPVLITQMLLAFALPLLALAPTVPLAALAIFFYGMMLGGMDVAMNANAVTVERGAGKAIMSSFHGFWSIGGFVGAGAGGAVIAAIGPVGHTLLVGGFALAMLWPVWRHMLEDRQAAPIDDDQKAAGLAGLIAAARRDRTALATALAIGIFSLFAMVPEGAAIDWSAIYLRQDLNVDIAASGFGFAAFSAAMALFRFAGDRIRNRIGAVGTVRLSLIIAVSGLVLIGAASNLPAVLAGFALLGVGLSNIVPIAFSAAGNIDGLKPGIGIAIATTFGYSGILIAPAAIGALADRFGFPAVFLGMSTLLVVILAMSALMAGADHGNAQRRTGTGTKPVP